MAKSKKNVDAFKKAMLSNTKVIKEPKETDSTEEINTQPTDPVMELTDELQLLLNDFSNETGIPESEVVHLALEHFFKLKEYWLAD